MKKGLLVLMECSCILTANFGSLGGFSELGWLVVEGVGIGFFLGRTVCHSKCALLLVFDWLLAGKGEEGGDGWPVLSEFVSQGGVRLEFGSVSNIACGPKWWGVNLEENFCSCSLESNITILSV